MRTAHLLALCLLLSAAPAAVHADEVQLRGGTKIEGKAKREGDTVVIKVESGEIRLSADSVEQIKKSESSEEVAERRRAALAARDVRGRLQLAGYCREHELPATERALLLEVLEIEPDQPQARRLLGYERDEAQPGRWVDRRRQQQEARAAEQEQRLERQRAQALELARVNAERQQREAQEETLRARDEALRARDEALRARDQAFYNPYYAYPVVAPRWYPYPRQHGHPAHCGPDRDCSTPNAPTFPIAGVRHPRDTSFFLPGVKDPRESLR